MREFPADVLGAAIVGLTYPPVRDAVMAWLVPAMAVGLEEDLAGAKVRSVLVKLTGAQGFAGGSLEDCERMRERLREFVTVCPVERSSLLGGVVGMFLWSLGQGVLARHVWEAALAAGPSGLAVLGLEVVRAGVGPGALLGGRPLR